MLSFKMRPMSTNVEQEEKVIMSTEGFSLCAPFVLFKWRLNNEQMALWIHLNFFFSLSLPSLLFALHLGLSFISISDQGYILKDISTERGKANIDRRQVVSEETFVWRYRLLLVSHSRIAAKVADGDPITENCARDENPPPFLAFDRCPNGNGRELAFLSYLLVISLGGNRM